LICKVFWGFDSTSSESLAITVFPTRQLTNVDLPRPLRPF